MANKDKMTISPEEYRKRVRFTDDFFFNRVMQDKKLCRELAEVLLGVKVESVDFHETQRVLRREKHSHGIQLDVMLEDSKRVIVFEAQMANKGDIERRTRFYQGVLDTATLHRGSSYRSLKDSYIVFICTFDPFKLGLPVYTVNHVFKEAPKKNYDDGTHAIFYNCPAWDKCQNENVRALMKYADMDVAESDFTRKVEHRINYERETQRLRSEYMTYQMKLDETFEEGTIVGERKKAVQTARAFLAMGLTTEQVAQGTGLPIDEVEALL